ncbi:MAG: rhomboid family intramembrane serine protease [Ignavibacteriales bacterium]|nr:rhomboid family intramembrane serine protease [Ignavibacteriales bacterium]MCF8304952.1 rhomboid family intramembrane serine protease [Ignavibacteriales bacterium]MCF8314641.1 rhomboid family intramembrane serine protease [Ignavibacteriales bacterium]MCF8436322.1 rhomboid family intramembrane serine protease [Ignavibacteriales bacterium]
MGYQDRGYYKPAGFGGFTFFPPIIKNLLIINAAVFVLGLLGKTILIGGIPVEDWIVRYFGLIPLGYSDVSFYPWQLITYQFIHGGFSHIFFNMFMLWMFGMELENLWGSSKFLFFYLLSGVGAGLLQLLGAPLIGEMTGPTIGASGAVYGVMIAFAMFFPDRYIYIYFLLPVKAKYLIAFLIVIEFLSVGEPSIVAHLAHIGGALTGFIFILLDRRNHFSFEFLQRWLSFGQRKTAKFRRPGSGFGNEKDAEEVKYYEIHNETKDDIDQDEIDRILDKISKSGYQNLSEREKKILFEASKK